MWFILVCGSFILPNKCKVKHACTCVQRLMVVHAAQLIVRILQSSWVEENNLSVQKTKTAYNASNMGICNNSWASLVAKLVKKIHL